MNNPRYSFNPGIVRCRHFPYFLFMDPKDVPEGTKDVCDKCSMSFNSIKLENIIPTSVKIKDESNETC